MAEVENKPIDKKFVDLTGKKFGFLLVLNFEGRRAFPSGNYTFNWRCRCDCGNTCIIAGFHLSSKHTTSCGCKRGRLTHRKSYTRAYRIWQTMKQRCQNPKSTEYYKYGARGIKVCSRWEQFENFYADMGDPPKAHSIDRRDNDGNYEPNNCHWATQMTQCNNTRTNHRITFQGQTKTLSEWSRELGIKRSTIGNRLHRGFSIQKTLTPSRQRIGSRLRPTK